MLQLSHEAKIDQEFRDDSGVYYDVVTNAVCGKMVGNLRALEPPIRQAHRPLGVGPIGPYFFGNATNPVQKSYSVSF